MTSTFRLVCALAMATLLGACPSNDNPNTDAKVSTDTGSSCGNHTCDPGETSMSCAVDCVPPPVCGDKTCDATETQTSCPADCGAPCGNGVCDGDETTASCAQDCPPVCGNHTCEVGETISSCATDCQNAACTVGDPNSCTGDTICINNACVNAFGRNYKVWIKAGVFPAKNANGEDWDDFWDPTGKLPDGKVRVTLNGSAWITSAINETLTPTWNQVTGAILVPGGAAMKVETIDQDPSVDPTGDDPGWTCNIASLAASTIRAGYRCQGTATLAAGYVDLKFIPQ